MPRVRSAEWVQTEGGLSSELTELHHRLTLLACFKLSRGYPTNCRRTSFLGTSPARKGSGCVPWRGGSSFSRSAPSEGGRPCILVRALGGSLHATIFVVRSVSSPGSSLSTCELSSSIGMTTCRRSVCGPKSGSFGWIPRTATIFSDPTGCTTSD